MQSCRQQLDPQRTTWHITFGTYGTRLHGDDRPTVDSQHHKRGEPFVPADPARQAAEAQRMKYPPVNPGNEQSRFIEPLIPGICERGGWTHRLSAAGRNHVHVLLDIDRSIHGDKARRLIKRWVGQALSERWRRPAGASWWAEQGSSTAIHDQAHLNNAFNYIARQRAR